jgi:hypothetical protein
MSIETPDNKDDRLPHKNGDVLPLDAISPTDLVEYWTADGAHILQLAVKVPWTEDESQAVEFYRAWRPSRVERTLTFSAPHKSSGFFTTTISDTTFARQIKRIEDGDLYGIKFRHPECGDLIITREGVAPYEEPKVEMTDEMRGGLTTILSMTAEAIPLNAALLEKILSATPNATDEMMAAGVAAARGASPAIDGQIGHTQVRAIWDTMAALMPGLSIVGTEALKQAFNQRNDDLLAANTRLHLKSQERTDERDAARIDVRNAEKRNDTLCHYIRALYVAVMRKECPENVETADQLQLQALVGEACSRVDELMQAHGAPPLATKEMTAAIEAFSQAAEPFLAYGRGLAPGWSDDRRRSSLSVPEDTREITVGDCRRLLATHEALKTQLRVPINLQWIRRADLKTEDAVRLAGQQVYIRTDNGIWRSRDPKTGGGHGYTLNPGQADTWTFIEAYDQTGGCGPEKEAAFGYRV